MRPLDLELIKKRLAAATPGPWVGEHDEDGFLVLMENRVNIVADLRRQDDGDPTDGADLAFISYAPTDIAALIAEVERLRAGGA